MSRSGSAAASVTMVTNRLAKKTIYILIHLLMCIHFNCFGLAASFRKKKKDVVLPTLHLFEGLEDPYLLRLFLY